MQEYFGDEIIKKGVSTSGWFQHDTIEHLNDCFSDCIEQSKLDKFFELSTIEEQRIHFQKISSNLEDAVLQVIIPSFYVYTYNNYFHIVKVMLNKRAFTGHWVDREATDRH